MKDPQHHEYQVENSVDGTIVIYTIRTAISQIRLAGYEPEKLTFGHMDSRKHQDSDLDDRCKRRRYHQTLPHVSVSSDDQDRGGHPEKDVPHSVRSPASSLDLVP